MADDKPYQSLYRKYRPQGPSEVLGQDHVIRALSGAVREGRLAHAFLLCGPRGTGKTSTARILAKMVNCESGPTPEPCGSCDQCVAVRDGQHLDVVEIDAASHGGVDDARDLREKAPTAPVQGREKVYIIDEAQRLSREAFDALLKVFEEPPVGVRFVLATTEPHKMPATIVGRCQRFDFRRVPVEAVAEHLERIAKDEGMSLTAEAAHAIARQTEGSVRRRVVAARPGLGAGRRRDRRGRRHVADRERALGRAVRARRRGRGRGRQGCVRAREPARAGGSGSPLRDQRGARALPQPLAREDGAGSARPARRDRPGGRAPGRAGHEVLDARARPRDRAADRGADRHALDHLAAPLPRARPDPGDDPRDRRRPRGARLPPRTPRARGRHHEWWWRLRGAGSRLRLAAAVARSGRSGLQGRRLPVAFRRHPCAAGAATPTRPTTPLRRGGRPRPEPGTRPTRRHRRSRRSGRDRRRVPKRAAPPRPRPVRPRPVRRPSPRRCRSWGRGRLPWM